MFLSTLTEQSHIFGFWFQHYEGWEDKEDRADNMNLDYLRSMNMLIILKKMEEEQLRKSNAKLKLVNLVEKTQQRRPL